jgi:ubiquinone/menaquinone biosynthesis C-methylase UbiE
LDINPELLDLGRERAQALQLSVTFEQADLNTIDLPLREYDVVFCHASLHHVIELERVAEQIKRTLRPGGELIILDVVTRKGYLMWPGDSQSCAGPMEDLAGTPSRQPYSLR